MVYKGLGDFQDCLGLTGSLNVTIRALTTVIILLFGVGAWCL